jgi:PAS domain S-box-containing protein
LELESKGAEAAEGLGKSCPVHHSSAKAGSLLARWTGRLRSLFSSSGDGAIAALQQSIDAVITIDALNNITFYNAAAERLWGLLHHEVIGRNVSMLVPLQWRPDHDSYIARNRDGQPDRIVGTFREVPIERADGQRRWVSLAISRITLGRTRRHSRSRFARDDPSDLGTGCGLGHHGGQPDANHLL